MKLRKILIISIILIIVILSGLAVKFFPQTGYVLFIYTYDSKAHTYNFAEAQSGFNSLQSCLKRGELNAYATSTKPYTTARCAKNCPISAESDRDCENSTPVIPDY